MGLMLCERGILSWIFMLFCFWLGLLPQKSFVDWVLVLCLSSFPPSMFFLFNGGIYLVQRTSLRTSEKFIPLLGHGIRSSLGT